MLLDGDRSGPLQPAQPSSAHQVCSVLQRVVLNVGGCSSGGSASQMHLIPAHGLLPASSTPTLQSRYFSGIVGSATFAPMLSKDHPGPYPQPNFSVTVTSALCGAPDSLKPSLPPTHSFHILSRQGREVALTSPTWFTLSFTPQPFGWLQGKPR